jgi:hypothetical protein
MTVRAPPKFALWLLKRLGSPYQGEALAGDLIEQYQDGRSRAWWWRQVIVAIVLARWRFVGALPWAAVGRLLWYLLAEKAAVLAVVVVVDRDRHAQSLPAQISPTFFGILLGLIAIACSGFLASARPGGRVLGRVRGRAATTALLLAFGVIALGVGTLTWALTAP